MNEAPIKLEIQQWLEGAGYFWLRLQSGKVKVRGGYMQLCPEGTADIIVFPANITCWIETKKMDGKQRAGQIEFEAKVKAAGHEYLVARSLDEVRDFLGRIA